MKSLLGCAIDLRPGMTGRVIEERISGDILHLTFDMRHDCAAVWEADRGKGGGMARFHPEDCTCSHSNGWTGCGEHWHCLDCGGISDEPDALIKQ
jgi:hypothetical protein